jgi:hypothetical protein
MAMMIRHITHSGRLVSFANTPSTLVSAGGIAMPVSGTSQFNFAVILGPSTSVGFRSPASPFTDPAFQIAGACNTNDPLLAGRLVTLAGVEVGTPGGYAAGDRVDLLVRGWSANAGST